MQKDIKELRIEMKSLYKNIRSPVFCNILDVDVYFNADGLFHLRYDGTRKKRPTKEEYSKLSLLPLVIPVIKSAKDSTEETRLVGNKRTRYWALIMSVGKSNTVVKVILRQVDSGRIYFFSVMRLRNRKQKTPTVS